MTQHINFRSLITYLCIIVLFAGCSGETTKSKLSFDNNNECISWQQTASAIRFPQAHSGNYVCKINKDNPFSAVLDIRVKDISDKPLRKARITAWFMLTSNGTEQNLVMDVRDSTMQNSYEWINVDAADYNSELNKWSQAELVIDLTKKDRNNINNVYRIYASNGRSEPVYVDDFEVSFEE
jgi:hypothetical protein